MDTYIWLGLMIVFLVVEISCPIHLVSIWFAAGSLIAGIAAVLNAPIWLQVLLFFVVSCALLASLWPFVKKVLNPKDSHLNSVIGDEGYVIADIDNLNATGQVKLGGMEWTARSASGEKIPTGTLVKVEKVEGVKVFVSVVEAKV